jgi:hypothetical protein
VRGARIVETTQLEKVPCFPWFFGFRVDELFLGEAVRRWSLPPDAGCTV